MKKIRNLLAIAFCSALVILGMQLRVAAQERPQQTGESPGDLGKNAGTGDPRMPPPREGSWDLVGIKSTAIFFDGPRQSIVLPIDTRERRGINWGKEGILISAAVKFMDLKKTLKLTNREPEDPTLTVFVEMEITKQDDGTRSTGHFVSILCFLDATSPSGERLGGGGPNIDFRGIRDPVYYPDKIKKEFTCGGDRFMRYLKPGEDFTLNYKLQVTPPYEDKPVDVTYHFSYQWAGWEPSKPVPGDSGVAPSDKEGQYRWAQKQDALTLESTLNSAAARLFNSGSVSAEKLSSAFADVSVIVDRAAKPNFPADSKDAASPNWTTHKNWAARAGPKAALDNLQQKLAAAFASLSRSQKDVFFAEASVAMAKVEGGGQANELAGAPQDQNRPLVKPTKSVFGINEKIAIDYYNPKGSGWDWVVIVNPNNTAQSGGPHSSIDKRYGRQFDANDNSLKDRNGTFTFDELPEGEYEARYIAWYFEGKAGENVALGPVRFRVGNQVSAAPPPGPAPGTNPPPTVNPAKDLTGLWKNPGANVFYRVRQIGTKLVWGIDAVAMGSWANVFQGQIAGNTIDGVWEDLPGSPSIGGGRMLLRIESECRFVRVSSVNPYGADVWVKKDSMCDVASAAQRSNPSGVRPANKPTKAATANKQTPPVVAINDRDRVFEKPAPTNKPNKPAPIVEEIPEDNSPKVAVNTPARKPGNKPPVVEEIPEDTPTTIASNTPTSRSGSRPPVVEEIPEDTPTTIASNRPTPRSGSRPPVVEEIPETPPANNPSSNPSSGNSSSGGGSGAEKLPPNVKRDKNGKLQPKDGYVWENPDDPNDLRVKKKPRDPNKPDFWTNLGGALREAITQQPQQQPQQQPGTTASQPQQQHDGPCRGGSYWLGTPTPESWRAGTPGAGVRIPWSTPVGVRKAYLRVFSGDRAVFPHESLPENANDCGLSWSFYPGPGYYDVYLYDPNGTAVAGPVRFTVHQ